MELKTSQTSQKYIRLHFPDLYAKLDLNTGKWPIPLYLYLNGLRVPPQCPVCGKPLKLLSFKKGFAKYCSVKCNNSDVIKKEKVKETCRKKYGVSNPMQSDDIKKKLIQTLLNKYGVDNIFKDKDKIQQSFRSLYGVSNPSLIKQIRNQAEQTRIKTMNDRYGVTSPCQVSEFNNKRIATNHQSFIDTSDYVIGYTEDGDWICKCPHPDCNQCEEKQYIINSDLAQSRRKFGTEMCTHLLKYSPNISTLELHIRRILDEMEIGYINNDRRFGIEMDIYIPSLQLAIEVNGSYWHSTQFKSPSYHIQKSILLAENGIRCVFVWDDYLEEDIEEFLKDVIEGNNLESWKQKWFPDIDGWPVDFGLMGGKEWVEHKCQHGKFECYDSGVLLK